MIASRVWDALTLNLAHTRTRVSSCICFVYRVVVGFFSFRHSIE